MGGDKTTDWLNEFDAVIVGSGKPAFFQPASRPMFEVDVDTGLLANTDDGSPVAQIGLDEGPDLAAAFDEGGGGEDDRALRGPDASTSDGAATAARVYQAGHYKHLNRMLGVRTGSEILYVGDHIYGDILRSKKQLGWRTMLIVPELSAEIACWQRHKGVPKELRDLRQLRESTDDELSRVAYTLKAAEADGASEEEIEDLRVRLWQLRDARDVIRAEHKARLKQYHEDFHPVWGQLLKTGYQNSRFANQVSRFACLYTSHVANLRYYSPEHNYRSREDYLPHET